MCFAGRRFAETREHAFDRRARGDFAEVVAADAVGKREEPAVAERTRSGVSGATWPEIVFVSLAHFAEIGKLREFDVHRIL